MVEFAPEIGQAVDTLRRGGLVAFPTETVYGLGADALNPEAVRRLFAAKGRPASHPVIVHLAEVAQLERWASDPPEAARRLAEAFWPGPLTLIVRRSQLASDLVTGGQDTVGLRVPSHPVAQALLSAFDSAVAAPSANRFGHISPTRAEHVAGDLGDLVDMILDGGPCEVGLESTIVDLSTGAARVLRPGGIGIGEVEAVLGYEPEHVLKSQVRASGTLERHYAPKTRATLVSRAELGTALEGGAGRLGVLSYHPEPANFKGVWLRLSDDAEGYARALYAALRELDALGLERILIEDVPKAETWLAVRDRLRRATFQPEEAASL